MTPTTGPRPYWLAAIVIAIGLIWIWGASSLPPATRYAGIGPRGFPTFIGGALVLLGIILALQISRGMSFEAQETENADAHAPVNYAALLMVLAAATLPILTLRTFGLPLTAMVIFALVARAFGSRKLVKDLLTGLILGSLAWLLFDRLGLQLGQFLPIAGI